MEGIDMKTLFDINHIKKVFNRIGYSIDDGSNDTYIIYSDNGKRVKVIKKVDDFFINLDDIINILYENNIDAYGYRIN